MSKVIRKELRIESTKMLDIIDKGDEFHTWLEEQMRVPLDRGYSIKVTGREEDMLVVEVAVIVDA